jgi:hypothetical protein
MKWIYAYSTMRGGYRAQVGRKRNQSLTHKNWKQENDRWFGRLPGERSVDEILTAAVSEI